MVEGLTFSNNSAGKQTAEVDLTRYGQIFTDYFGSTQNVVACEFERDEQGEAKLARVEVDFYRDFWGQFQAEVEEKAACEAEATIHDPQKASLVEKVLEHAKAFLGTRHVMGGLDLEGIDCSGLVIKAFEAIGRELPRISGQQAETGEPVEKKELLPGDLVFFSTGSADRINHVGIVSNRDVDEGKTEFIHTSTSRGVMVSSLSSSYWTRRFKGARRIIT
jgi:cell wall-associated NlpC family hydrolase